MHLRHLSENRSGSFLAAATLVAAGACVLLGPCGAAEQSEKDGLADSGKDPGGESAPMSLAVSAPDGVTIHYDDQGKGEVSILFVHGWNCDRRYWGAQRDYFARKYRVVTVDLAGHGESSDNRDEFSMIAFGGDVAAVAQFLDLRNIVLVGHSMGGTVVLAAASQLGSRVAAVVAVDTLRNIDQRRAAADIEKDRTKPDEEFVADSRAAVAALFVEQSDPKLRDYIVRDMLSAPLRVSRGSVQGLATYDAGRAIAALRVPLVVINSDFRPTNMAAIEAATDAFQYIEMSGVGHFVMLEDPVTFNRHLTGVIQSLFPDVNATVSTRPESARRGLADLVPL